MKVISYRAVGLSGKAAKGELRAESVDELYAHLAGRRETLAEILEIREESAGRIKLSGKEMLELFETLGNLTESGLRVQNAIEVARELRFSRNLDAVVRGVDLRIERGGGFAQAFSESVARVPPLIDGMLRIGERSGQLDRVVGHCTAYLRMMQGLREKIASAATYPAFILALMGVGITLLLTVFIPSLQQGLGSMKGQAAAIGAGYDRIKLLLAVLLAIVALPVGTAAVYRWARGARQELASAIERALLRLPGIGAVATASQLFSLSFTLEVLLDSGVPLQEALGLSRQTIWSMAYRELLADAGQRVKDGAALSAALSRHQILPAYFVRWIGVAEKTGQAGRVFGQLRNYYQKQLDIMIGRLTSLIEPVMIAGVGMLLLAVISAVVLPLFSMYAIKV